MDLLSKHRYSVSLTSILVWQTTPGSLQRTSISSSVPSALPTSEGGREGEGGGKRETERERKRQRKRLRYRGRVNQKRVRIEKACISEFFCTHHLFFNKSSKKCILLIFFSVLYGWRLVSGCFPLSRYIHTLWSTSTGTRSVGVLFNHKHVITHTHTQVRHTQ